MEKLKYYQLAHKDGAFKRLISPSERELATLIKNGWKFYGFDKLSDIPINPIIDGDIAREMTEQELTDKDVSDAEEKLQSDIDNLTSCKKLELYDAMKDDMLETFEYFETFKEFNLETVIDFNHPIVKAEMTKLEESVLYELKKRIIQNRSK